MKAKTILTKMMNLLPKFEEVSILKEDIQKN